MIPTFQGQSADNVWLQAAEAFRRSDGVRRPEQPRRIDPGDPSRRNLHRRPPPALGGFQGAPAKSGLRVGGDRLDYDRPARSGLPRLLEQKVSRLRRARPRISMVPTGTAYAVTSASISLSGPTGRLIATRTRGRWSSRFGTPGTTCLLPTGLRLIATSRVMWRRCQSSVTGSWSGLQVIRSNDMMLGVPHKFCPVHIHPGDIGRLVGSRVRYIHPDQRQSARVRPRLGWRDGFDGPPKRCSE